MKHLLASLFTFVLLAPACGADKAKQSAEPSSVFDELGDVFPLFSIDDVVDGGYRNSVLSGDLAWRSTYISESTYRPDVSIVQFGRIFSLTDRCGAVDYCMLCVLAPSYPRQIFNSIVSWVAVEMSTLHLWGWPRAYKRFENKRMNVMSLRLPVHMQSDHLVWLIRPQIVARSNPRHFFSEAFYPSSVRDFIMSLVTNYRLPNLFHHQFLSRRWVA